MSMQIGDFIALATLATNAFQALNSSRGSKSEFTSLLGTLKAISRAMVQAEALCIGCHTTFADGTNTDPVHIQRLDAIVCEIVKEREECERLIQKFLKDFKAYREAFAEPGKSMLRQSYRSLTWMSRKDEAAVLEKRLNAHLQSLQMRLQTFYYVSMKSDVADNSTTLGSIDSSVTTLTTRFGDMQLMMSEAMSKLDVVEHSLPASIGYCWGPDAPILLLDGLGRKSYLPMMLANTPDIFREILLIMHRGGPGYDKIDSGKYVVSDEDFGGALIPRERWSDSVLPGRHIGLSFLLKHPAASDEKHCPRCRTSSTWLDDQPGRRRCLKCHLTFKIEDQERTRLFWKDLKPRPRLDTHNSSPQLPTKRKESITNKRLGRSQTLPPDEYPHPFRRVHYQRDVSRRASSEQRWTNADPEFSDFLAALPPVHRAAASGDVEKLDELLGDGDNDSMNWRVPSHSLYRHDRTGWDFTGAPPIHFAAYYGHNLAVIVLLRCGADINAKDAAGTIALHAAAWTGNESLFQMLLKRGANPSISDSDGWSVAMYAMSQGNDNISRLLLGDGEGDEEMLVKTYTIRHAAKLGNLNTVLGMLLEDQAEAGNRGPREQLLAEALFGASEGGHEGLVQRLLDSGADPAATDSTGSTALHWTGWGGHAEIGNLAYDEKGDVEADDEGPAPKERLTSTRHEGVMQMLLDGGADINAQNCQGCTALHWVAGAGSVPMIQWMLNQGADPGLTDSLGRTPVDRAVETGDVRVLELLRPE